MIEVKSVPGGFYEEICHIAYDKDTKETGIIDPGGNKIGILKVIEDLHLIPKYILLTHSHADHIGAVDEIREALNIPVYVHKNEEEYIGRNDGLFGNMKKAEYNLDETSEISLGNNKIKVIETPGHTTGGVCFYIGDKLIVGDTLFRGSIGRTDFPGGNMGNLLKGVKEKLFILPDNTIVYPGHGPSTTIGFEKENNPYF